jgi:phosphate transport system substrate-binding protein
MALALTLAGCGKKEPAKESADAPAAATGANAPVIRIDGSSTVFPIAEAVAEEYQVEKRGTVRVTVGLSGTGGGFKKLGRGDVDISNASRPILAEEMELCRKAGITFYELPVAFDAITVVVNPKNEWVKSLTVADLKKMWEPQAQGKITRWNQVRPEWPDAPLMLFGPGADSGTFDYFTEAVVGKAKSSRGDYTASEDDNVIVQGLSGDPNALGYLPYAYVAENEGALKVLTVDGGNGECVAPSEEAVQNGSYQPLSRPLFFYVNAKSLEEKPAVQKYVDFFLAEGGTLAEEVAYTPLPDDAYAKAKERVAEGKTGTIFGGHPEVGLTIDDLLNRELKS